MFETIFKQLRQTFCTHRFAYNKSETIGGDRVAIQICMDCRKKRYLSYSRDVESWYYTTE
jgi:hypothetical protein